MQAEVMSAGFGGQGIMIIGKLLALAGMKEGREVAWIPSYGPEMRGGTAYCTVVVADRPIGSPVISNPTHLVVMNRPSLEKFAPVMKTGGTCMINSSLISIESDRTDIKQVKVPCNEIAIELGNPRAINIVALGAFVEGSGLFSLDLMAEVVRETFAKKPQFIEKNLEALSRGAAAARG